MLNLHLQGLPAALAMLALSVFPAAAEVGIRTLAVTTPERPDPVTVALWYPAGAGGTPELVGENAVFEGTPARRDAGIADGSFPLVLVSHGGLRVAPNQSGWIAAELAARGNLVAVVQPPRPASAQEAVAETWLRPADLSAALTAIGSDPATAPAIAEDKASVVGFFLGGTAGLALGGARLDADSYRRSCDPPAHGPDCAWFEASGVDLSEVDPTDLARSGLDDRIGTIVAVDPELTGALAADSLSGMAASVTLINLGTPGSIAPYLDASGLQALLPGARYVTFPEAGPFSAMAVCKPKGAAILAEEGEDDSICREEAEARTQLHARLAGMIDEALSAP